MLRSLLSARGVNPQMITVFIDGYYEVIFLVLIHPIGAMLKLLGSHVAHCCLICLCVPLRSPWTWWSCLALKVSSTRQSALKMPECPRSDNTSLPFMVTLGTIGTWYYTLLVHSCALSLSLSLSLLQHYKASLTATFNLHPVSHMLHFFPQARSFF